MYMLLIMSVTVYCTAIQCNDYNGHALYMLIRLSVHMIYTGDFGDSL